MIKKLFCSEIHEIDEIEKERCRRMKKKNRVEYFFLNSRSSLMLQCKLNESVGHFKESCLFIEKPSPVANKRALNIKQEWEQTATMFGKI